MNTLIITLLLALGAVGAPSHLAVGTESDQPFEPELGGGTCVYQTVGSPTSGCAGLCTGTNNPGANKCCWVCWVNGCRKAYIAACPAADGGGSSGLHKGQMYSQ